MPEQLPNPEPPCVMTDQPGTGRHLPRHLLGGSRGAAREMRLLQAHRVGSPLPLRPPSPNHSTATPKRGIPRCLPHFRKLPRSPNTPYSQGPCPPGGSGQEPWRSAPCATHHEDAAVAVAVDAPELEVGLGLHGRRPGGAVDERQLAKAAALADVGHPLSVHVHLGTA